MTRSTPGLCSFVLLSLVACSDGPVPEVMITDSAGVRVAVTRVSPLVFAEVDSVPALSIGGPDATGPAELFRIQGIYVDPRDRIWVADGQSAELRIFNGDGSHWKTRGGRGEGPGEFMQIHLLGAFRGDSVVAGDAAIDRVTIFDPEGEFVRTERVLASDGPAPRAFDVFRDGSVLGQQPRVLSASSLEADRVLADSVELVRVRFDSSVPEQYAAAAGPLWVWTGRSQVPMPFTVNASFRVIGDAVHLVSGSTFRIRVFERGELRETYGTDRPVRAVKDPDIQAYRAFVQEYVPESMHRDYLAVVEHTSRPPVLPGYDRVLNAPDGYVWAQVYESDVDARHGWDVFDAERRFVGRASVPEGFDPMVITESEIVGIWRDGLGVEHVHTYRLHRE